VTDLRLPVDVEAEEHVIGAMVRDGWAVVRIVDAIDADAFTAGRSRLFDVMRRARLQGIGYGFYEDAPGWAFRIVGVSPSDEPQLVRLARSTHGYWGSDVRRLNELARRRRAMIAAEQALLDLADGRTVEDVACRFAEAVS
jgi:hypothetical protein